MGGRGASSGRKLGNLANGFNGKWFGIKVTNNGGVARELFFQQQGNITLMRNSLYESAKKSPISAQKFFNNAQERSRKVEIISPKIVAQRIRKRNQEIASKPDYENGIGTEWGNKDNRRAARMSRLAGRISKR